MQIRQRYLFCTGHAIRIKKWSKREILVRLEMKWFIPFLSPYEARETGYYFWQSLPCRDSQCSQLLIMPLFGH